MKKLDELWFAFKKLYLWYSEQRNFSMNAQVEVVICFQKIVSLIFWTTASNRISKSTELWFAFKKLYLWYSEQLFVVSITYSICCDLLSKNCIFDILNNVYFCHIFDDVVVICFQKIVSLIFWTTHLQR